LKVEAPERGSFNLLPGINSLKCRNVKCGGFYKDVSFIHSQPQWRPNRLTVSLSLQLNEIDRSVGGHIPINILASYRSTSVSVAQKLGHIPLPGLRMRSQPFELPDLIAIVNWAWDRIGLDLGSLIWDVGS